jgi:uncharacterized PurR-regulated membrane protein YhhQ (DUF165 family)
MPLKSFHGTTDPATPMGVPSFHRVQRLFLWIAAALCAVVVADNVSFKPMTGFSIKGADYLYLGVAGVFLVMAALRRDLGRKMAAPVVMIVFTVALI